MAPSKVKNENPDDFATYLAKRQAAAEGREWTLGAAPAAAAPAPSYSAPAPAGGDVDDVMARVNAMMRGETPPAPVAAPAAAPAPSYAAPAAGREDAAAIMARVNQQSGGSPPPAPTSTWRWSGQDLGGYNPRARGGRPAAAAGATPGLERPVAVSNEDPAAVLARAMAMMN